MSSAPLIGFDGIATFVEANADTAKTDLGTYFGTYAGRWFEHFSDLSDPNHLNANDIAACGTLSVEFDGRTIDQLMKRSDEFDEMLALCPPRDTVLWELETGSYDALSALYEFLRGIDGMGPVRTSKLLACKRPHAVPIRDSVVEALLGAKDAWWGPWQIVVADAKLRELVDAVTPGGVPSGTSILRRLDVILWMHGTRSMSQPTQ